MATTKRFRRHAREIRGIQPGSTRWQILIWGNEIIPESGEGFADEHEARETWRAHRAQLMCEFEPGSRPAAYFRFELGVEPGEWSAELGAQLDRQLVGPEEALRIEGARPILASGAERFYAVFDDLTAKPATFRVDPLAAAECALAARWHAWRGRVELSELFAQRARNIHEYLTGFSGRKEL